VVQVALSLVLLTGAGLFLRTLDNLRAVDVGFNPQNLVLFNVNPRLNGYDEQRSGALYQQMQERLAAVAGVRGVALSNPALLSGSTNSTRIFVQGRPSDISAEENSINRLTISPNFFEVMGIPLLVGRGFTDAENNATAPKVAVVNDAAAKKYFAGMNPVGMRFGSSVETSGARRTCLRAARRASTRWWRCGTSEEPDGAGETDLVCLDFLYMSPSILPSY
jgi:putative ABC transport system permease protein